MFSIRDLFTVIVLVSMCTIIASGIFGERMHSRIMEGREAALSESYEQIYAVHKLQFYFKQQVQEWKNILLRGKAYEYYHEYLQKFYESERNTRKEIKVVLSRLGENSSARLLADKFSADHRRVGRLYRQAISIYNETTVNPHEVADKYVLEVDRSPSELLDQMIKAISEYKDERLVRLDRDFDKQETYLFAFQFVFSISILFLVLWLVGKKISAPVAVAISTSDRIAAGDFEEAEQPASNIREVRNLFESLEVMRKSLLDMTSTLVAIEELEQAHSLNEHIISASPIGIAIYDQNGQCIAANDSVSKMIGATREQVLLQNYKNIDSWKRDGLLEVANKSIRLEQKERHTFDVVTTFDRHAFFNCLFVPFKLQNDQHLLLMLDDVTEYRKAVEDLRKSEERFQFAVRGSSDGLWDWDIKTGTNYYSPRFIELLGYSGKEEFPHVVESFFSRLHPDDVDRVSKEVQDHFEKHVPYVSEYRLKKKDGSYVWFLARGQAVWDEDGEPVRMAGNLSDISDRKKIEESLQRFKSTLDMTLDCVFMFEPDTLQFFYVNAGAQMQIGYSEEELLKMTPVDIKPEYDEASFREVLKPLIEGIKPVLQFETIHQHKNGTNISVEISLQYIALVNESPRFVAIVREISERKAREEEILRLVSIIKHSPDFIGFADLEGRPQYINEAGRKLVGIDNDEEFYSHMVIDFFQDKDRDFVVNTIIPHVMSNGRWHGESNFCHFKSGEVIPVSYDMFRIDDPVSGEPINFATITRDIRENKKIEQELDGHRKHLEDLVVERTHELEAAQDELVRKERLATLGQLTATVSHELRNPLGAMKPSLYVIEKKSDKEDERLQQAIERIDRNIDRCDNIIDELLDFTRITELDQHAIRIDEWLESVIGEQEIPRGIRIEKDLTLKDTEMAVDSGRLRRAVINVIENAIHAMLDDNRQVRDEKNACLCIKTQSNNARIEIVISDTGTGISEDIMGKIFEPLFSTKGFGVGLGMPTVKQIMGQHGGGIEIDSEEGKGTIVTLWFPGELVRKDHDAT